jgi:hypothetical protein
LADANRRAAAGAAATSPASSLRVILIWNSL